MSAKTLVWSRAFDDLIILPDGRMLRTLHDAGHYVAALPKAMQQRGACEQRRNAQEKIGQHAADRSWWISMSASAKTCIAASAATLCHGLKAEVLAKAKPMAEYWRLVLTCVQSRLGCAGRKAWPLAV